MKKQDWLRIVFIGLGTMFLVTHIPMLAGHVLDYLTSEGMRRLSWWVPVYSIGSLIGGILLLVFNNTIAQYFFPDDSMEEKALAPPTIEYDRVLELVLLCMGIFILARSIPTFVSFLVIHFKEEAGFGQQARSNIGKNILSEVLKIAIGLYLVFGRNKIVEMAGYSSSEEFVEENESL
jgi:hypothetical protein